MTTATKTVKAVNYTPEQTVQMVADYAAGKGLTVEAIAAKMGKSTRSIVAKLSREKVYIAKVHVRKDGAPVQKKNDTADIIGKILKLNENDTESLTKCTRVTLQAIFKALANSVPVTPENDKPGEIDVEGEADDENDDENDENDDENE